jgi:antitoxin component YwqK of YwqJK toxin-antitoxin module
MFRISPNKLVGLIVVACAAAVAVPSALAKPTGPEGSSSKAAIAQTVTKSCQNGTGANYHYYAGKPCNTPSVKVTVNGNNTIAYLPNGCRVGTIPYVNTSDYRTYYANLCVAAPATTGSPANTGSTPTGKHYGDACVGGDGHTYEYYGTEAAC